MRGAASSHTAFYLCLLSQSKSRDTCIWARSHLTATPTGTALFHSTVWLWTRCANGQTWAQIGQQRLYLDTQWYANISIRISIYTHANQNVSMWDCHIWVRFLYLGVRLHTAFMIIQEELMVHMDWAGSQFLISKILTPCLQQDPFYRGETCKETHNKHRDPLGTREE